MDADIRALDLVLGALIVAGGLIALKSTQYARPALYFTTASFFDRRADVRTNSIAARLAIPTAQGAVAVLIFDSHHVLSSVAVAAATWFLAIWPAIWNPSLLPHSRRGPIWLLIGLFWVGFAVFAALGALSMELILGVLTDDEFDLRRELVTLFLGGIIGGLITRAAKAADKRVSFADDDPDSG